MRLLHCCLSLLLSWPLAAPGDLKHQVDPDSGLSSWKRVDGSFSLELIQVLPDYVRAAYASRGLPSELIEKVVSYCIFGSIVRNESEQPLSYRVADWRYVTPDGQAHTLKTKSEWVGEWREMGVAFRWSMLPDDQTLEAGDWSQGFSTVKLPPDSSFELHYTWSQHGHKHTGRIEGLRCAPAESPLS